MVNPSYQPSPFAAFSHRLGVPPPPPPGPNNCSAAHWEDGVDYFNGLGLGEAHGTGPADCWCAPCRQRHLFCAAWQDRHTGTQAHKYR